MKSFLRSNTGKTVLFLLLLFLMVLTAAGIFATIAMLESDFYSNEFTSAIYGSETVRDTVFIRYPGLLKLVRALYRGRYYIPVITALLLLPDTVLYVVLMNVTARRQEDEEVHPGPLAVIPTDIFLVLAALIPIGAFLIFYEAFEGGLDTPVILVFLFAAGVIVLAEFLAVSMSIAGRIKAGTLFRNTLIAKVIRFIVRVLKWILGALLYLIRSIPLIWRTILVITGISLFEFFLLMWTDAEEGLVIFWFLEKLLLVPLVLYAAIAIQKLKKQSETLAAGNLDAPADTRFMIWDLRKHAENLGSIREGMRRAVENEVKSERMKTELITNVSHDIKTPLTSIINYSDLIQKEECDNEKIREYSEVISRQSARLKRLIEDLVEASKASTGNLEVNMEPCDAGIFLSQAEGEYREKLQEKNLQLVVTQPEKPIMIRADGRRMWRVIDNLMNNICKYAQPGTRVYLSLEQIQKRAVFTFRNISGEALNISEEELMERFVRGDRSRNSEGNGLGLSIARSLTELQEGTLFIRIDGDLFKVIATFPVLE